MGEALFALLPVLLASMLACCLLGLIIEWLAYRPLRRAPRLTALITAIGVSLFLENAAQIVFKADPKFFPSVTPQGVANATIKMGGVTVSKDQLILVVASALLMGIFVVYRAAHPNGKSDAGRIARYGRCRLDGNKHRHGYLVHLWFGGGSCRCRRRVICRLNLCQNSASDGGANRV